jgi:hypothetical protein
MKKRKQRRFSRKASKLPELKEKMTAAADAEDYREAAKLRDIIRKIELETSPHELTAGLALLEANAAFFDSFSKRSPTDMAQIWADEAHDETCDGSNWPVCVHPFNQPLRGKNKIVNSWRQGFARLQDVPSYDNVQCTVFPGGQSGLITCTYQIGKDEYTTANVFTKGFDGKWRLVMHHAGFISRPQGQSRVERMF